MLKQITLIKAWYHPTHDLIQEHLRVDSLRIGLLNFLEQGRIHEKTLIAVNKFLKVISGLVFQPW